MNTVSQKFNWSRFVATLRKEVLENKRAILFSVIGIYAFLTIFMILGNWTTQTPAESSFIIAKRIPHLFVFMILSFVVCAMSSMAFRGLTTKQGRTSLLMSPSSSLEKYLVNVLIYVVATLIVFFACAQLADLTRIAVLKPFEDKDFVVPGPINFLNCFSFAGGFSFAGDDVKTTDTAYWMSMAMIIGTIANAAIYVLGSVVWPRLSFLKTFVAVFAVQSAIMIIVMVVINVCSEPQVFGRWFSQFIKDGSFFQLSCVISTVLTIVSFALSWYLFKRKDVVSLKWWK